jgi:hypothetical protein
VPFRYSQAPGIEFAFGYDPIINDLSSSIILIEMMVWNLKPRSLTLKLHYFKVN